MKRTVTILMIGIIASLITILWPSAVLAQNKKIDAGELRERDVIRQTFKLAPGARVEVSSIRGPVEVRMGDSAEAEIHIVRSAQSRDALKEFRIGVEKNSQVLFIRGEQRQREANSYYSPEVRHHVMLRLPRRVDLFIQGIAGEVHVGDMRGGLVIGSVGGRLNVGVVDGHVRVSGVSGEVIINRVSRQVEIKNVGGNVRIGQALGLFNVSGVSGEVRIGDVGGPFVANSIGGSITTAAVGGQAQVSGVSGNVTIGQVSEQIKVKAVGGNVKIAQAVDHLDVSGIAGTLTVGIAALGQRGVQINSVGREVELRFRGEINAQLSTNNVSGKVLIEVPNVIVRKRPYESSVRALMGKGGPLISINGISNDVRLVSLRKEVAADSK